jgi:hypothetical protein
MKLFNWDSSIADGASIITSLPELFLKSNKITNGFNSKNSN